MSEQHARLRKLLIQHEGIRLKPYFDTEGKITIGVGRNLDDMGLTEMECMILLSNDIARVEAEAVFHFPWYKSINMNRQNVILSMLFNLGLTKFKLFKKFIQAMVNQDYNTAADEMLDSQWAKQVGLRARELATMMRLG